jgi:hypothetical protein
MGVGDESGGNVNSIQIRLVKVKATLRHRGEAEV